MSTKETVILFAHKCKEDYVNEINISESLINAKTNSASAEFIVILDISGSMGSNVNRIITKILPNMLTKLKYLDDDIIHLITFASCVKYHQMTKKQLENSTIKDGGRTYMREVFDELSNIILTKQTCFRILTISDGDVSDQTETLQKGSEFAAKIKGKYSINSQAVRFFTSLSQPDTTALSSVLQLNTVGKPTLIDINSFEDDNKKIIDILYSLFIDDLDSNIKLQSKTNNLRIDPWAVPVKEIKLNPGKNVIWSSVPDGLELLIGKKDVHPVKVQKAAEVSKDNYKEILGEKIDCYIQKLKVLKVVGTEQAKKEMDDIIKYFHSIEPVSAKMEQIRNENNIDHLDNEQKAEYLRNDIDDISSEEEEPTVVIPVIQCDPNEIKKEIDAKITNAKEKIAVLLKNKEHMIEEKKKEMIREINSLYAGDDGIDIFCANYFNKALIEKMRQELDIDLLEGVPLKDNSANEELRDTECSFCKKNNNDKMYKNDIDQNYICNNCYEVLKEYYPADYIKLHNKIE